MVTVATRTSAPQKVVRRVVPLPVPARKVAPAAAPVKAKQKSVKVTADGPRLPKKGSSSEKAYKICLAVIAKGGTQREASHKIREAGIKLSTTGLLKTYPQLQKLAVSKPVSKHVAKAAAPARKAKTSK